MSSDPPHQAGIVDRDCDEGCCWQYFCTCGAVLNDYFESSFDVEGALAAHVADLTDHE